jgi:hypothetical protein
MNTGAKPALCIRPELSTMHVIPLFSPEKWKKQASVSRRTAREEWRVFRLKKVGFRRFSRPTGNARFETRLETDVSSRTTLPPV